ncbi:RibD family protein [Caenispirillum salinarum]|uniref:RibD family protein n=1 Tax=Caenispirillum salinarum TaxID=859058 RepID=UPI00384AFAA7
MTLDIDAAWRLILAVHAGPEASHTAEHVTVHPGGGWAANRAPSPEVAAFLDLYLPLAAAPAFVLGHLGQSLDGRIACSGGHSHTINDAPNIDHMHRLRALADAVVVGAGTARADDPRLTTRRVQGASPTRVIIAGRGPLDEGLGVFTDHAAPTLLVRTPQGPAAPPGIDAVTVAADEEGHARPAAVVAALRERGLARVFVEGGGRLVSAFLGAGVLDRLQVCVAPLLLGSGIPAVTLPPVEHVDDALRPAGRWLPMGRDMLFDCVLTPAHRDAARHQRLSRTSAPGDADSRITTP